MRLHKGRLPDMRAMGLPQHCWFFDERELESHKPGQCPGSDQCDTNCCVDMGLRFDQIVAMRMGLKQQMLEILTEHPEYDEGVFKMQHVDGLDQHFITVSFYNMFGDTQGEHFIEMPEIPA